MLMTFLTVFGLTFLLMLCVVGFVALCYAACDSSRHGNLLAAWACWDLAAEVLKVAGLVLFALVQAVGDASKG